MKPSLIGFLFSGLLIFAEGPLLGQINAPMGRLGIPLGTFAVIEGIEQGSTMLNGGRDFVVEIVNGKKVPDELSIPTDWPSQLPDKRVKGKRYVLHGYEVAVWAGEPQGLPANEHYQIQSAALFSLQSSFSVTSVEKIDGVTVADARPLDPKVPLAEPDFAATLNIPRPIGILGLPLGTFAVVQVSLPDREYLTENPFAIMSLNGKLLSPSPIISIPGFQLPANTKLATLHGFESGGWISLPQLPRSEIATQAQKSFQFFPKFVVTSIVSSGK